MTAYKHAYSFSISVLDIAFLRYIQHFRDEIRFLYILNLFDFIEIYILVFSLTVVIVFFLFQFKIEFSAVLLASTGQCLAHASI